MAQSNITYTPPVVSDLQVVDLYTELMIASTNEDSIYIKAKESMEDYLNDSDLNSREKAQMLSDLIAKLSLEISNSALSGAIKVAIENQDNDYKIGKMHEDILMSMQQRDKIAADVDLTNLEVEIAQTKKAHASVQNWELQSKIYRDYGVDTKGLDPLANITLPATIDYLNDGSVYWNNSITRSKGLDILSSTVRNYGVLNFSWRTDEETQLAKVVEIQGSETPSTDPAWDGLVKQQRAVAVRQETGFDDNMRQHAANSSANMVGLLVSSDAVTGTEYEKPLQMWMTSMGYLNNCTNWSCPDPA